MLGGLIRLTTLRMQCPDSQSKHLSIPTQTNIAGACEFCQFYLINVCEQWTCVGEWWPWLCCSLVLQWTCFYIDKGALFFSGCVLPPSIANQLWIKAFVASYTRLRHLQTTSSWTEISLSSSQQVMRTSIVLTTPSVVRVKHHGTNLTLCQAASLYFCCIFACFARRTISMNGWARRFGRKFRRFEIKFWNIKSEKAPSLELMLVN